MVRISRYMASFETDEDTSLSVQPYLRTTSLCLDSTQSKESGWLTAQSVRYSTVLCPASWSRQMSSSRAVSCSINENMLVFIMPAEQHA